MRTTLIDNINNNFYEQRATLTGNVGEVTVLVEDYDDVCFWDAIIRNSSPRKKARVIAYQRAADLSQGKPLIIGEIAAKGGSSYVGCVDSDNDYMLNSFRVKNGGSAFPPPHIFHTYGYSIESLVSFAETLDQVRMAAFPVGKTYDFVGLVDGLSKVIYELFVTNLFMISLGGKAKVKSDEWDNIFSGEKAIRQSVKNDDVSILIDHVEKNANTFLAKLKNNSAYQAVLCQQFEKELIKANPYITKNNCCRFCYGHAFFDMICALITEVCDVNYREEKFRISGNKALKGDAKQTKQSHLDKMKSEPKRILMTSDRFILSNDPLYLMIKRDLARL